MRKLSIIFISNAYVRAQAFPFLLGMLAVFVFVSCVSVDDSAEPPPTDDAAIGNEELPLMAKAAADLLRIIEGNTFTLDARASSPASGSTIRSYFWEQIDTGPRATVLNANTDAASVTAPLVSATLELGFRLTVTGSDGATASDIIGITVVPSSNVDADGDGLIEIGSLEMLHNMRYNLAGTSYKIGATGTGDASGCPNGICAGYELIQNLDFNSNGNENADTDGSGNGSTWTGNSEIGFTLDTDDANASYFDIAPDGTGGWLPIGDEGNPFTATFEGNGYTISNLAIRRDRTSLGFFGASAGTAHIRNIGLVANLVDYIGSSDESVFVGGLVGYQTGGSITASYTTGPADGGNGDSDAVGALVGTQGYWGTITGSYTTGTANGGAGNTDRVGGLVGHQDGGGNITASYTTGTANGAAGDEDRVGALVGVSSLGSVTASYTTGTADGGAGRGDRVGRLVGVQSGSTIVASYGFAGASGESPRSEEPSPAGLSTATELTVSNAGGAWNNVTESTAGAWDFGTASQTPALRYADYDGLFGDTYSCDPQGGRHTVPAGLCNTIIPGQGR